MANLFIDKLQSLVKERFENESADHDWYHIERVLKLAEYIQSKEGGNLEVVQAAALLHDISDHKLNGGIKNDNGRVSRLILIEFGVNDQFIDQVCAIVDAVSFKGAGVSDEADSIELAIVRDADRLDAMGAIGIARAFHFGGSRDRKFYVPDNEPTHHADFDSYSKDESHTINHFYEKLLLLQNRLHTTTAKSIGKKRHQLMQQFVDEFLMEWNVVI